jgi:predicted enzyme related to lactoylglutathione lyase
VHRADRARGFYGALFGWEFEPGPARPGTYTLAVLGGRWVAAIADGPAEPHRPAAWTPMLAADDVDAAAESVRACGGTVGVGPLNADGEGRFALAVDPSGAVFGIWRGERPPGADLTGVPGAVPGAVAWNELWTWEASLVAKFYQSVFGHGTEPPGDSGPDRVVLTAGGRAVAGIRGMGTRLPRDRGAHWMTYFGAADADEAARRAVRLGGRVVDPPADAPYGRVATLADPTGAAFALVSPAASAAASPAPAASPAG